MSAGLLLRCSSWWMGCWTVCAASNAVGLRPAEECVCVWGGGPRGVQRTVLEGRCCSRVAFVVRITAVAESRGLISCEPRAASGYCKFLTTSQLPNSAVVLLSLTSLNFLLLSAYFTVVNGSNPFGASTL
jgi:hypothetical protein